MSLQQLTRRFIRFNLWANERLISFLLTLPQAALYSKTGSSFGTIDRTLQHILAAQRYWHPIIVKGTINEFDQPERENAVDQVIADLLASSKTLVQDFSRFDDQQLKESVSASDSRQSRYEYILHVVNHGSYHRGQIVTMCRALAVTADIPVTDYDAYLWWIENMGDDSR